MKLDLKKYQKQNTEKLDAVGTSVSIERPHKEFIETNNINLSALVRDVIDGLIAQQNKEKGEIKSEK